MIKKNILCVIIETAVFFSANTYAIPSGRDADSFRGQNMSQLIQSWGTPNIKIINPNGTRVFIYKIVKSKTNTLPTSPSVGVNVSSTGRPVMIVQPNSIMQGGQESLALTCIIQFEINKKGTIISTTKQGNGCN